jgi:hypothetical protein
MPPKITDQRTGPSRRLLRFPGTVCPHYVITVAAREKGLRSERPPMRNVVLPKENCWDAIVFWLLGKTSSCKSGSGLLAPSLAKLALVAANLFICSSMTLPINTLWVVPMSSRVLRKLRTGGEVPVSESGLVCRVLV